MSGERLSRLASSADVLATEFAVSFEGVVRVLRVLVLVGPVVALVVARTACRALRAYEVERQQHGAESGQLVQLPSGGYEVTHGTRVLAIDAADETPMMWDQDVSQAQLARDVTMLLDEG